MSLELKQLYYLKVCAQTRSFTQAAAVLYTSQSNVSKVIRSLEDELGFPLFERQQYGIALTRQGQRIYASALETLDSAARIMDYAQMGQVDELRISANASHYLARIFARFYHEHGERTVSYSYITASTNEIIARLSSRQDQLGFVYVMDDQLPQLQARLEKSHIYFTELTRGQAVLYLGAGADPETADQADLVQGYDDEFALRTHWNTQDEHRKQPDARRIAVTTNSDYVMSELLAHTGLVNISAAHPGAGAGDSVYREISLFPDKTPVILGSLARNDSQLDPQAVRFLKYMRTQIALDKEETGASKDKLAEK